MANEEHLKIFHQGIKVWNQWRKDYAQIRPDLRCAHTVKVNLRKADLSYADLFKANFNSVDLNSAKLKRANLSQANLEYAKLNKADLSGANLMRSNLSEANLTQANMCKANLSGADLRIANLSYADLSGADLSGADLSGADLSGANLGWAILIDANFITATLSGACLSHADLRGAELSYTSLRRANLTTARFGVARLLYANLDGANLTEACLWEIQRAGWSIKDIICESVYWDEGGQEKTFYQPGDFERLFSEQNKIKLFYKDGANLLEIATLPSIIKNLEEKHPGCKLSFQSIEETSGGAIATLVLEESKDIAVEEVEAIRAMIQAEAERNVEAFRHALVSKDRDIAKLEGEVETLDRIINSMMSRLQPVIYNISGTVGAAGHNAHTHDNTFNQIVNAENSSVETQIQGDRNAAIDGNVSDGNIITGDENKND